MNPLPPLNTREGLPNQPAPPKPDPRRGFEAHVRQPHAQQGRGGDEPLPDMQAPLHADDATVPLDVRLAMAGMSGRIYLQGLHVNGYLSMLAIDRAGSDLETASCSSPEPTWTSTSATAAAVAPPVAANSESSAEAMAVRADSEFASAGDKLGATEETTELRAGVSAVFADWARRLVRFNNGTATLWIRDYRLDAPQQRALVEQLQTFARDAGTPLKRIVLNGQDLWRDGALTPLAGKGEPHGR